MRITLLSGNVIVAVSALLAASGCAICGQQSPSAKWAMADQQYSQEHSEPYSSDPEVRRSQKAWDMADASFQEGNSGVYIRGGGTTDHWPAAVGSLGVFRLPTSWSTVRCGVMGMDNGGIGVGGIEAGARLHAPTRFTPYVGLSTDLGISGMHSGTRYRHPAGEPPTNVDKVAGLAAIVPEAGVSYWLTPSSRMNVGASYFVAAGQTNFVVFGVSNSCCQMD